MSLRDIAAADLVTIIEDPGGFRNSVTVTNPAGVTRTFSGLTSDIGLLIDPDTQQAVTGRRASVALPISRLLAESMGMPRGIADSSSKPWVISFANIHGQTQRFKVQDAMPDTELGVVVCTLEAYKGA